MNTTPKHNASHANRSKPWVCIAKGYTFEQATELDRRFPMYSRVYCTTGALNRVGRSPNAADCAVDVPEGEIDQLTLEPVRR